MTTTECLITATMCQETSALETIRGRKLFADFAGSTIGICRMAGPILFADSADSSVDSFLKQGTVPMSGMWRELNSQICCILLSFWSHLGRLRDNWAPSSRVPAQKFSISPIMTTTGDEDEFSAS